MLTFGADGSFEWRVGTGHWRWLLLGSLGVAASACWGKADEEPTDPNGGSTGLGGSSRQTTTTSRATTRCSDPTPLGGGWEKCANGLTHRAAVESECASSLPRAEPISPEVLRRLYPNYVAGSGGSGGAFGADSYGAPGCVRDSDCTGPFGHCEVSNQADRAGVFCEYGCVSDSDCESGMVCACGSPVGQCKPSSCQTDADCNGEGMCANFEADPGCPHEEFACQTRADKCATNADCPDQQSCTIDRYSDPRARHCSLPTATCGRPFLVEGAARVAGARERADWYPARQGSEAEPRSGLRITDSELRGAVAQGWLDQALMEHASVAAFARFSLQLLSLGAPAELVADSGRALQDEIAHARDCFALARRHTQRDIGPGPLPLEGALDGQDLRSIVLGTIAEGCIGETLAALEAAEARAHCTDPAVRSVLDRISADETRHAELAWRFLAWALETGPTSLRVEVQQAFARELSIAETVPAVSSSEVRLLSHGLMGAGLRAALRRRVLSEVIGPCLEALLGRLDARSVPGGDGRRDNLGQGLEA